MYYPEGMKARVSPVQSIEPHRILAPTRDSNQEPPGPESRVVTTIILLHIEHFEANFIRGVTLYRTANSPCPACLFTLLDASIYCHFALSVQS